MIFALFMEMPLLVAAGLARLPGGQDRPVRGTLAMIADALIALGLLLMLGSIFFGAGPRG
jgi:hypothetical protein